MKTTCEGTVTDLDTVPAPRAFTRATPGPVVTPPFQGRVRVTILAPPTPPAGAVEGANLAVKELRAAGAPLDLLVTPLAGEGAAAGRIAYEAAARASPSAIVSLADNATTEGMVPSAAQRRVPLLATEATSAVLTTGQETNGMVLRVPPPDATEGRAAADLVWASGCRTVNVVLGPGRAESDVATAFRTAYEAKGGAIGKVVSFAASPDVEKTRAAAKGVADRAQWLRAETGKDAPRPEAILVLASPDASGILLREAWKLGVTAKSVLFFTGSAKGARLVEAGGDDANGHPLAIGLRGTAPMRADTGMTELFAQAFELENGAPATNASLRAYDAVYAVALAATCARAGDPQRVAEKLPAVANADGDDTRVSGADPAAALTAAARCSADYVGATHDYDWTRIGDPAKGRFHTWVASGDETIRVAVARFEPAG